MKSSIVWTRRGGIPDVSKGIESQDNVLFLDSVAVLAWKESWEKQAGEEEWARSRSPKKVYQLLTFIKISIKYVFSCRKCKFRGKLWG